MKKRLLITSIVMMLVVAVALSTATYAWFTSNASVSATSISLEAATNNADAIGIGWTLETIGTSIDPDDSTALFTPAVPAAVTAGTLESAFTFKTATIRNENSADVYNGVDNFTPYNFRKVTTGDNAVDHQSFYVKNLSTATPQDNLYVWADVDGEGAEMIRIAIFKHNGSAFEMVGVLGYSYTYTAVGETAYSASNVYYKKGTGYVAATDTNTRGYVKETVADATDFASKKGAEGADLFTRTVAATTVFYGTPTANEARLTTNSATVTNINLLADTSTPGDVKLAAQGSIQFKVFVWFDGDKLDDQTQSRTANIKLNFAASAPTLK